MKINIDILYSSGSTLRAKKRDRDWCCMVSMFTQIFMQNVNKPSKITLTCPCLLSKQS